MYRLSKAAMELRDKDLKVVDVAMDFVFDSHEGFTRAFRKQFGNDSQRNIRRPTTAHLSFSSIGLYEIIDYWLRDVTRGSKATC